MKKHVALSHVGIIPVLLIFLSAVSAFLAYYLHIFVFKAAVAGFSGCAVLWFYRNSLDADRDLWLIIAAFVFSVIGDWFLSTRSGDTGRFIWGICFFFLAHLAYLGYSLCHGRPAWLFTSFVLAGYLTFYVLLLYPAISDKALGVASLLYLFISCISLGGAVGTRLPLRSKNILILGIGLILFSDTIIAFKEFVKYKDLNFLILPTYYLAQMSVAVSTLFKKAKMV